MKILHIIESLGGGGAETSVVRLSEWWALQGHEVHVAVSTPDVTVLPKSPKFKLHVLTKRFSLLKGAAAVRLLARELQPDYIYGHMPKSCVLAFAAKGAAPEAKLAFVEHNTQSMRYSGLKKPIARALTLTLYRAPDAVLAVSQGGLADIARFGGRFSRGHVVYNPIPLTALQEAAEAPTPFWGGAAALKLVTVGRLSPAKGYDVLLDALHLLHLNGTAFTAVIVGDGPERPNLVSQAKRLGIADSIRFIGFQKNPAAIVAKADMFVCASRYEGFSNVLAEALAVGTDCISTDCPSGPAEILGANSDRLVLPGDPSMLSNRILELHEEQRSRSEAAWARARAENKALAARFDVSIVAERYLSAFD